MAWDHDHLCTHGFDLIDLFSGIKNTFIIVSVGEGASASATADLIHSIGIKIDPVFHALIQNPSGFFKKAVAEMLLGLSSIIAWIMVGCELCKSGSVQLNTTFFDVLYQQIKYRNKSEFGQCFRIICFKTRPGRKVRVASLGPEKVFDLKLFHLFYNPAGHHLHGVIITRKISPTCTLPVFRSYGPVFFGRMKNFPPML
jgi:hypothetical protein